jgi:hypothetical protein
MEEKQKSKHGGYRENSPATKPLYASGKMRIVQVRLTDEHIEKAKQASEKKEVSEGIRFLIEKAEIN